MKMLQPKLYKELVAKGERLNRAMDREKV